MSEVVYLVVVTWGGEVSQEFRGPAWELREWLAARPGGTVLRLEAVGEGETAARTLLELVVPGTGVARVPLVREAEAEGQPLDARAHLGDGETAWREAVGAAGPEAQAVTFKVMVGSGWATVQIGAEEPVSQRWTRSVWPAVCAARAASAEIVAKIQATKAAKAGGDAKAQKV